MNRKRTWKWRKEFLDARNARNFAPIRMTLGKLTILRKAKCIGRARWVCKCACGKRKTILACNIISGASRSCGCVVRTKKLTCSPEYVNWANMKARCSNPNAPYFKRYGGRGIKVCDRWRNSFVNFLADVGPKPGRNYSLDRYPNRSGNYEPGNVRWATSRQQANNVDRNRIVRYRGTKMTLADARRLSGTALNEASVRHRLDKLGWNITRALEAPSRYRRHA